MYFEGPSARAVPFFVATGHVAGDEKRDVRRASCAVRGDECDVTSASCGVRRASCEVRRDQWWVRRTTWPVRRASWPRRSATGSEARKGTRRTPKKSAGVQVPPNV